MIVIYFISLYFLFWTWTYRVASLRAGPYLFNVCFDCKFLGIYVKINK